jgi:hypothetical protein
MNVATMSPARLPVTGRLCTLFSNARAAMAADADHVDASLGPAGACSEWNVEVFCNEGRLAAALAAPSIELPGAAAAALGHIVAKQQQEDTARRVTQRMNELPDAIVDAIEPHVLKVVEKPVLGARPDRRGACVARLSVLVRRGREHVFHAVMRELGWQLVREGACFDMSGPARGSAGRREGFAQDPAHADQLTWW